MVHFNRFLDDRSIDVMTGDSPITGNHDISKSISMVIYDCS